MQHSFLPLRCWCIMQTCHTQFNSIQSGFNSSSNTSTQFCIRMKPLKCSIHFGRSLLLLFALAPSATPQWKQYPGLTLQDALDRLQSDVENLKNNLSTANQRYTEQLQLMENENAQLRQGLVVFLQRFATVESETLEMNQGMGSVKTRLQAVQTEVGQLANKSTNRFRAFEQANNVWRRNFKMVNRALKVLKRKVKFRVPV